MKIGVIADCHDNLSTIYKGIAFFNYHKVDLVLNAGDFVSPFAFKLLGKLTAPCVAVFGNNEGEKVALSKMADQLGVCLQQGPYEYTFAGKNILLMHEPYTLRAAQESGLYDLVVYGHTHESAISKASCLTVNPGECCGYVTGKATVALVALDDMTAQIYTLKGGIV